MVTGPDSLEVPLSGGVKYDSSFPIDPEKPRGTMLAGIQGVYGSVKLPTANKFWEIAGGSRVGGWSGNVAQVVARGHFPG